MPTIVYANREPFPLKDLKDVEFSNEGASKVPLYLYYPIYDNISKSPISLTVTH